MFSLSLTLLLLVNFISEKVIRLAFVVQALLMITQTCAVVCHLICTLQSLKALNIFLLNLSKFLKKAH